MGEHTMACEAEDYDREEELDGADCESEDLEESHAESCSRIDRSGNCTTSGWGEYAEAQL